MASQRRSGIGLRILRTPLAVWLLDHVPLLQQVTNRLAINYLVGQTVPRPYPYSLWTPAVGAGPPVQAYVSWTGLVDRSFTCRHLPPAPPEYLAKLPPLQDVLELFQRREMIPSRTSSTLFCFFAQWFTDSFLRTSPLDSRRTDSNHEIDLCQIYGLSAETAAILRERHGGRLHTSEAATGVFPARLFDRSGALDARFRGLPYVQPVDPNRPNGRLVIDDILDQAKLPPKDRDMRRRHLYATGLERGNSTILYTAISTVFVREHNRICAVLQKHYSDWDDDRLFETARNVNIAILLRLIVEEYINHLADLPIKFFVDRSFPERRRWYRTNRISIEFNLLYRWHSLVPDTYVLGQGSRPPVDFRFNNALLEQFGVEHVIWEASRQHAGRICLRNTPSFLLEAERAALSLARTHRVRSYNEYRERFGLPVCTTFEELTDDPAIAAHLRALYGAVDRVELVVGLFAECHPEDSILGELMRIMVAVDAFSHALTNPLLSSEIFGAAAFSEVGLEIIGETRCLEDLVRRNAWPDAENIAASFDATRAV